MVKEVNDSQKIKNHLQKTTSKQKEHTQHNCLQLYNPKFWRNKE